FLHAFQLKRNAQMLLEQADEAQQAGKPDLAADFLGQYLGLRPKDTDALARYAVLLEKITPPSKGPARAHVFFLLEQVLRDEPGRDGERRRAAKVARGLGLWRDARHHLDQIRDVTDPPDVELLRLRAQCELGAKEFEKAADAYDQALGQAPEDVGLWERYLAVLREGLGRPDDADRAVARMVAANPRSVKARLLAARHCLRGGRAAQKHEADKHVRFALEELKADGSEALLLAAEVAGACGRPDEARRHLERGVKLHPKDAALRHALARTELRAGRPGGAVELLAPSLKDLPADPVRLWE